MTVELVVTVGGGWLAHVFRIENAVVRPPVAPIRMKMRAASEFEVAPLPHSCNLDRTATCSPICSKGKTRPAAGEPRLRQAVSTCRQGILVLFSKGFSLRQYAPVRVALVPWSGR
jgi:hypothetical protein